MFQVKRIISISFQNEIFQRKVRFYFPFTEKLCYKRLRDYKFPIRFSLDENKKKLF